MPAKLPSLLPVAVVTTLHAALAGAALYGWLVLAGGGPDAFDVALCASPGALALALGFTSQDDRRQYVARLLAASMMAPLLLAMWAGSQPVRDEVSGWWFFVPFVLLQAAAFAAIVLWLAGTTTRVDGDASARTLPADVLAQRLRALRDAGVPIVEAGAGRWVVDHRDGERRVHRVLLDVDAAARAVRVRERLGVHGDVPRDDDEASLRGGLMRPRFDPARPDATAVWNRTAQATMLVPERLEAARVALGARGDRVPRSGGDASPEAWLELLAAVVTRAGFDWRPTLGLFAR
jgi:hypothetical protein